MLKIPWNPGYVKIEEFGGGEFGGGVGIMKSVKMSGSPALTVITVSSRMERRVSVDIVFCVNGE